MAITSVLFSGVGGQGIILASKVVGRCAFAAGCDVKESELHGMAQRGGSVISHVRFGDTVHSRSFRRDRLISMWRLKSLKDCVIGHF